VNVFDLLLQFPLGVDVERIESRLPDGIAFVVVPNREATFDSGRPATTWDHVRRDHVEGPEASYDDHLREYSQLVDKCEGAALVERVAYYRRINYSIHFHVWNAAEFRDFLERVHAEFGLPFEIESFSDRHSEMIAVSASGETLGLFAAAKKREKFEHCAGPRTGMPNEFKGLARAKVKDWFGQITHASNRRSACQIAIATAKTKSSCCLWPLA
jgi:hypothetical protein